MIKVPGDLPLVQRRAVRLVVLDSHDRLLLFHTRHVNIPDPRTWWELPGGGIEPGESYVDAAIRELREETGIRVGPADVGPATWRRLAAFRLRRVRRLQYEVVMTIRLGEAAPAIDGSGQTDFERRSYFGSRWWPVSEVTGSTELFYPGRLPELLPGFLDGVQIDEPFELWS